MENEIDKTPSKDFINWRCNGCRRILISIGREKDSFGTLTITCYRAKCKALNNILLFEGSVFLIGDSLKKNQKLLLRFKRRHEEMGLSKEQYGDILSLIK